MTKSRRQKKREAEKREEKERVKTQRKVQLKEVLTVPVERRRNGKKDAANMNMFYHHCLRSVIARKCPVCGRVLTNDRQGGLSCPVEHIVGWKIGYIHEEVDILSSTQTKGIKRRMEEVLLK